MNQKNVWLNGPCPPFSKELELPRLTAPSSKALGNRYCRIFAQASAAASASLSILITLLFTTDSTAYQGMLGLAIVYSFVFMIAAYWTLRMSRIAAISALILYAMMHHSNCGVLHMMTHLSIFTCYLAGIAGTIRVHLEHRRSP